MKFRYAVLVAIDSIKYQEMQVDIEIGRRTESLDECQRASLCFRPFQSGLFDQKS
jgi:hypothetical protein